MVKERMEEEEISPADERGKTARQGNRRETRAKIHVRVYTSGLAASGTGDPDPQIRTSPRLVGNQPTQQEVSSG